MFSPCVLIPFNCKYQIGSHKRLLVWEDDDPDDGGKSTGCLAFEIFRLEGYCVLLATSDYYGLEKILTTADKNFKLKTGY